MSRRHQFRYARPPRLTEYSPILCALVPAFVVTAAALISVLDASQRTGNALDDYGIWLLALAAWVMPIVFGLELWRKIRAYQKGEPAISVDDNGITLRGMTGKPLDLRWSDVDHLELERRSGKIALLIRAGSISGAVPLDNLHVEPKGVWNLVKRSSGRVD